MRQPFAVFLDIDGTIFDRGFVPEKNIQAIYEMRRRGGYVFLNTGRPYCDIPKEVLALPIDGYICALGTYVRLGDRVLRSIVIEKNQLKQIACYGLQHQRTIYLGGEEHMLYIAPPTEQRYTIKSASELDTLYQKERINKTLWPGRLSVEDRAFLQDLFQIYEYEDYAETVIEGYSKARGIQIVERYLRIPHKCTAAIGDSVNDLEMLEYVSLGIAMGNADLSLKRLADAVTLPVGEAGVAHAIENIIFPAMEKQDEET